MVIFFGIEFFYEFVSFDIKVLYFVVVIVCDKDVFLVFVKGYGYWVEQFVIFCFFFVEVEDLIFIGSEYMYVVFQIVRNDNLFSV